jgi:ATP synthase protein I
VPERRADEDLLQTIARKQARKLRARRERRRLTWFGLGAMGVVGWSVAIPTVLGVLAGHWLDERHPGPVSWSLTLLVVGATLGGLSAWRWLRRQPSEGPREDRGE